MKPVSYLLPLFCSLSACTNYLYQGEFSGADAYNKANHFTLYWPKTEPLLGRDKAGPAILMTDCSTTRIDFSEQPDGIVFRGEHDRDRLAGETASVNRNQICGKFVGQSQLADIHAGALPILINCEPMPADELAILPRNYPRASTEPYIVQIVEKIKRWSFFGETLPGPAASCAN